LADDLRVNTWLVVPAGELSERFSRSSGPGGQSVNTTDSRVELSFDVASSPSLPEWARERAVDRLSGRLRGGVLTVASSGERSQLMNREEARERLAAILRDALAPPQRPRVATKPGRGARERRLDDKRRRAQTKRYRRYTGGDQLRVVLGLEGQRDRVDAPPLVGRCVVSLAGEDMPEVGATSGAPRLGARHPE
jgi:ribosome-associated protein